jgi:hypothetical protein
MHLLWKRFTHGGYAPPILYWALCAGFAGFAIWGALRGDWLVATIAILMAPATLASARVLRTLAAAAEESARTKQGDHRDE